VIELIIAGRRRLVLIAAVALAGCSGSTQDGATPSRPAAPSSTSVGSPIAPGDLNSTSEEILDSLELNSVNSLTGCGPRDITRGRDAVNTSGLRVNIDADGLARGVFNQDDVLGATGNRLRLPMERQGTPPPNSTADEWKYVPPWRPTAIDYASAEYWDKRLGRVDTSAEAEQVTDDLATWASDLLATMSLTDPYWVQESQNVQNQTELDRRYNALRAELTALAERRKIVSYEPAYTIVTPGSPQQRRPSTNEDLLFLPLDGTETDRFGNTLATTNVGGSTEYRIVAAQPPGSADPVTFIDDGRLNFRNNGQGARNITLSTAFGEGLGGGHLDKKHFTFGAAVQFDPFPTVDPFDGNAVDSDPRGNEALTRDIYRYYFSQNRLVQGGRTSGWFVASLNLRCQIEITLNLYALPAGIDTQTTILVSERELDISHTSQILISVDMTANQVTLTTGDGVLEAYVTEVFDLPNGFQFSFDTAVDPSVCELLQACGIEPADTENFLEMSSEDFENPGITPGGLRGSVDWVYVANGYLDPRDAISHLVALDLRDPVQADRPDTMFKTSPEGRVASIALGEQKYKSFLTTDPFQRLFVIVQEALVQYGDNFDFVVVVPRDPLDGPALGLTDVARNYSVNKTAGTYDLDFDFPEPYAWGDPEKLRSVLIGSMPNFVELPVFLHEIVHSWANDVVYPSGTAQYLIDGHFGFSSANGYLGGFDPSTLRDEGSGRYSASMFSPYAGLPATYSDIELYLMGLLPSDQVTDLRLFVNASLTEERDGRTYFAASGSVTMTIDDIIKAAGPRALETDPEFEVLYIVVSGDELTDEQLAIYDSQAATGATNFEAATRGLATLSLAPIERIVSR